MIRAFIFRQYATDEIERYQLPRYTYSSVWTW